VDARVINESIAGFLIKSVNKLQSNEIKRAE
jgi:hypothetical protein